MPWHLIEAGVGTRAAYAGMTEAPLVLADRVAARAAPAARVRVPFVPHDSWLTAARLACMALADNVTATLRAGGRPLILGGECTIVAGSVAAARAAIPDVMLIYFDAHGDFNTLETTPSHFVGGMCLAHLCGRTIDTLLWPGVVAFPEPQVYLVGARDLDPGERVNLQRSEVHRLALGADGRDDAALVAAARGRRVWIHLDLDVIDPAEMFAVNFPAPGGTTFAALARLISEVAGAGMVRGIEVCAYDPRLDPERQLPDRITGLVGAALG